MVLDRAGPHEVQAQRRAVGGHHATASQIQVFGIVHLHAPHGEPWRPGERKLTPNAVRGSAKVAAPPAPAATCPTMVSAPACNIDVVRTL